MPEPTKQEKIAFNAEAKKRLVITHEDEFHELLHDVYEENGHTYTRPTTPEQEAMNAIRGLLNKHPTLLSKMGLVHRGKAVPPVAPEPQQEVNLPPVEDDAELPEGVEYEQLQQQPANPDDPWSAPAQ